MKCIVFEEPLLHFDNFPHAMQYLHTYSKLRVLVSYCYNDFGSKKRPKKRLNVSKKKNVSSHTENNTLDPIVRELEKVAKTEGIKSSNVKLVLLTV